MSATASVSADPGRCRFGLFEFDFRTGELRREGQVVKLSPQPGRVLALLLMRPGEVILREELRAHLWGDDTFVDFERGLNFCILQVRGALGDSSENPRFVQTVPRKGYRFIAPVAACPSAVPADDGVAALPRVAPPHIEPAAPERPAPAAALPLRRSSAVPYLFAALVVALAGLGVWSVWRGRAPVSSAERVRIAVLPFVNLTNEPDTGYLADALTDELISQVGQVSPTRLAVIARTSAMTYRRSPRTVAEIGRELNVTFVVESSVRREGTGLQIGSRLVQVADQTPIAVWSEMFGGRDASSRESQTGAAIRLAHLIGLQLLRGDPAGDRPQTTSSLAAWDAFLRGRALMYRGTQEELRRALLQFEAAVQQDPTFSEGWSKIAEARHLLVMSGAAAPADSYPRAREAARRAIESGPAVADAHLAQGLVDLWYDWRPEAAAASFARALAHNASSAAAHHDYAWALLALGRTDEAVTHITAARDLDPLSARANNDIGWLYLHLGQPADAARACQHTLAIQPASLEAQSCLERAYALRGLDDAALQAARASMPAGSLWTPPADAAGASEALKALWRWRLERLEEGRATRWINPYTIAVHHVLVGNTGRALDELEAAMQQRTGMMLFLDRDPALDPLRGDPRFQALVRRVREDR